MSSLEDKPPEIKSGQPRRGFWGGRAGALVVNLVLILAIVLSVLWLPPISLGKRLTEGDYLTLGEVAWSVADPDGTQFTVLPEGLRGTLKAKISAVPQTDFVQGTAGEDLIAAAESTPSFLDIKSPVYRLALRGEMPTAALLTIPIPNDALPYETLDLYAWSGAGWSWVPSQVLPAEDVIIAQLDSVTAQFDFVVAQTRGLPPVISADLADTGVPAAADGLVVELNPRAFVLTDNGQILSTSKPDAAADASFAIVPILSNVNADGSIRNDLVDNILVSNELRQTHIDAILKDWKLTVDGMVDSPASYSFDELLALARQDQVSDFHCVEGWSVYDVPWNGLHLSALIKHAGLQKGVTHVTFHTVDGIYNESLPLDVALEAQTMLAYGVCGATLPLDHGFPLRLVVPRLLAYKNPKYVQRIEFTDHAVEGYWVQRGYSYEGEVPESRLRD